MTVFDNSPLVGASSSEAYRVYLPWNRRAATFTEIGRSSDTGTGEVGQGYQNLRDNAEVTGGFGVPTDSKIDIFNHVGKKWRQMRVTFPSSSTVNRTGVFYATITKDSHSLTIPIIKISELGKWNCCTLAIYMKSRQLANNPLWFSVT